MFIIDLTYKVDLDQVNTHLEDHIQYLEHQYAQGHFQASGRKVPRTGGVILSILSDKAKLIEQIEKDPFKIHGLAEYTITEFVPSKTSDAFKVLLEH